MAGLKGVKVAADAKDYPRPSASSSRTTARVRPTTPVGTQVSTVTADVTAAVAGSTTGFLLRGRIKEPVTAYGSKYLLQVRDQGNGPFTAETRKSYLQFDLSSVSGVQKAELSLTGRADVAKNVMVFSNSEAFGERTRTWNNTVQNTLSWQGDPGGFTWSPPTDADNEYNWQLTLLKSPTAVKDVAVMYSADGSTIRIDGHNLTASTDPGKAIAITAPNATQVLLNGTRVNFTRSGSTVYAAAPA